MRVTCPYCQQPAKLVSGAQIYPRRPEMGNAVAAMMEEHGIEWDESEYLKATPEEICDINIKKIAHRVNLHAKPSRVGPTFVEQGCEAFWGAITNALPEMTTGDSQLSGEDQAALAQWAFGHPGDEPVQDPEKDTLSVPKWVGDERIKAAVQAGIDAARAPHSDWLEAAPSAVVAQLDSCVRHVLHWNLPRTASDNARRSHPYGIIELMTPMTPMAPMATADACRSRFSALRNRVMAGAFRAIVLPLVILAIGYATHYLSAAEIAAGVVQPTRNLGIYLGWFCCALGIVVFGPDFLSDLRDLRRLAHDMTHQGIPCEWVALSDMKPHPDTVRNWGYCALALGCFLLGEQIEGGFGTLLRAIGTGGVVVMGFKMGRGPSAH